MYNHSEENESNLHVILDLNGISSSSPYERKDTTTRFEKEANSNLEIANLVSSWEDFIAQVIIKHHLNSTLDECLSRSWTLGCARARECIESVPMQMWNIDQSGVHFCLPMMITLFFSLLYCLVSRTKRKKMYSFNSCSHVGTQTDPPVLSSRHVLGPNSRALGKGMCCCVAGKWRGLLASEISQ